MDRSEKKLLHTLARLYNVQCNYWNMFGQFIEPSDEVILRVLQLLGAPLERMNDVSDALRERRQSLWQRGIDPVTIAWDGNPLSLKLRVPAQYGTAALHYEIQLEDGVILNGMCQDEPQLRSAEFEIEGARYVKRSVSIPQKLPLGYHTIRLQLSDFSLNSHLFAAPTEAFIGRGNSRDWGLFCPLYALKSENNWGAGDFSDLASFVEFAGERGAGIAGTLPLLPAFLTEPYDPSPYSPVSRLFWNEFYVDVSRIPELQCCSSAQTLVDSSGFQDQIKRLRNASVVHYREVMALKRSVLEQLANSILTKPSARSESFQHFVATHPAVDDYAAFRAKVERDGKSWNHWSSDNRAGKLTAADFDDSAKQYHLYVQWQADEQMEALARKARTSGAQLYLDFPLGVNRDGYDVWRERDAFAVEASGGAPPDFFFTKGQNWGFPPLHPESIQEQAHDYYARCLRHHLKNAGMLRIDHVMGLHRLYWIPHGFAATDGVYVRYPADGFYAVLALESHRHQAQIVGENLGTVPPYVNAALAKHSIGGMYVGQFSIDPGSTRGLETIGSSNVASLNTHDTPTFAGFWSGADIQDSAELGLVSGNEIDQAEQHRARQRDTLINYLKSQGRLDQENDTARVLQAWLTHIAASDASLLLINLEDLWLETLPQNVPGTWEERPNWQRKARLSLAELRRFDSVIETLKEIDAIRKRHG